MNSLPSSILAILEDPTKIAVLWSALNAAAVNRKASLKFKQLSHVSDIRSAEISNDLTDERDSLCSLY